MFNKLHEYALYDARGNRKSAGNTITTLCAAHNAATHPYLNKCGLRTRMRATRYAAAIRGRMKRLGFYEGIHYKVWASGIYSPLDWYRIACKNTLVFGGRVYGDE